MAAVVAIVVAAWEEWVYLWRKEVPAKPRAARRGRQRWGDHEGVMEQRATHSHLGVSRAQRETQHIATVSPRQSEVSACTITLVKSPELTLGVLI